jgi:hypothetical protein
MKKLIEYRTNEAMCRQRAAVEPEYRARWLAQAEMWAQLALDEIATHFRECTSNELPPMRQETHQERADSKVPA